MKGEESLSFKKESEPCLPAYESTEIKVNKSKEKCVMGRGRNPWTGDFNKLLKEKK